MNHFFTNSARLQHFFQKAEEGNLLTIAFLGGSITQGSLATKEKFTYAARVYHWYEETFPDSVFSYSNRGVGGTDSFFGTARAEHDVLSAWPDLVFVDFSVNDEADDFHRETYEGLLRHLLAAPSAPAVIALGNARYDDGTTAEAIHQPLCDYYGIPYVSVAETILPRIKSGELRWQDLSPDGLHPNDLGHRLVAEVIVDALQELRKEGRSAAREEGPADGAGRKTAPALPEPLTTDAFAHAGILRRMAPAASLGFVPDPLPRTSFRDFFREGWEGQAPFDSATFELPPCANIGIQFRRTIHGPAPKADVLVDGQKVAALDGTFDEDWGDCLALTPVLVHGERRTHELTLTISEVPENCAASFYLLGILYA